MKPDTRKLVKALAVIAIYIVVISSLLALHSYFWNLYGCSRYMLCSPGPPLPEYTACETKATITATAAATATWLPILYTLRRLARHVKRRRPRRLEERKKRNKV